MTSREWFHTGMVGRNECLQETDSATEESLDVAGSISDIDGGALEADSSSLIDEEQDYHSVIDSAIQSFIQRCLMVAARAVMLRSQVISAEYRFLGLVR